MNTKMENMKSEVSEKAEKVGDKIQGNWNEIKGKLKQKYAELTDDDLVYAEGKEDELYGKLQKRLGISRDDAEKAVGTFTGKK
jgi:uncharacterized protein YjbJ (UPF0337 family)